MHRNMLLLSIHPEHADKIFAGTKCVELRKLRPRVTKDDWVLVYASSPTKALLGVCQVAQVIEGSPRKLWTQVRGQAGITKGRFDDYFDGIPNGFGIWLGDVKRLNVPLELQSLRQQWANFQPPQSYKYVLPEEIQGLSELSALVRSSVTQGADTKIPAPMRATRTIK